MSEAEAGAARWPEMGFGLAWKQGYLGLGIPEVVFGRERGERKGEVRVLSAIRE